MPRRLRDASIAGLLVLIAGAAASAAVTPELQRTIRDNTFEVVTKKPPDDTVTYEKPLPLELLPYIERTDAYRSIGTAFALGNNTYVTAAHVFQVAVGSQFGPPQLRRADGTVFSVDRILKYSSHEDFVVFSLKNDPAPPGFAVNREPKLDQTVLAVGNALGEGIVIRDGLFTSETPEDQDGRWKWMRFSAAASPGNSGGPLCDEQGSVVGVVLRKSPNENLNYSLPIRIVLDAQNNQARFDQKALVGLPFLHGTVTNQYKNEFSLPLAWPQFSEAVLKVFAQEGRLGREKLLKTYADTLFPNGPKTEDVFYDPDENDSQPRLIAQDADGTWQDARQQFHSITLPGDGSIAMAMVPGASLIRLKRSNAADDDSFYKDSKAFMDIALKALDLRRPVGTDQVRMTSLGAAKSDEIVADAYGRRWQQRVWAVPNLDFYLVAELLPTPDGYAGVVVPTPSMALDQVKEYTRLLTNQFDVSYAGTLAQWRTALKRKDLLPASLAGVKLEGSSTWTLQTPRVVSAVPSGVLGLTDKSFLTLTMGFMKDGGRTVWDVQEIRWDRDDAREQAVSVWRRAQPPETARVELRTRYDNIRARRMPYDGTLNRDTNEVFSATGTIDVAGPTAGSFAGDLQYGLTVYLVGHPTGVEADRSIADLKAATRVLEHGMTKADAASTTASRAAPAESAPADTAGFIE